MNRRRATVVAITLAAAGATFAACLPEYTFRPSGGIERDASADASADDAGDGSPDASSTDGGFVFDAVGAALIPVDAGATFYIRIDRDGAANNDSQVAGQLSHSFYIDRYEVTVRRFRKWFEGGQSKPCMVGTCTLDKDGPYEAAMMWSSDWNRLLGKSTDLNACEVGPLSYGPSTYAIDAGPDGSELPMTCVNWFDAAAYCASEGKRLPTDLEWSYVASSRGRQPYFPWLGSEDLPVPDCRHAIVDIGNTSTPGGSCRFPQPVGTADKGVSIEGVYDLTGSVFEWVWDVGTLFPSGPAEDYTAPPMTDADAATPHVRRGGSFNSDPTQSTVRNSARRVTFPSVPTYNDVGFRCAKTVP